VRILFDSDFPDTDEALDTLVSLTPLHCFEALAASSTARLLRVLETLPRSVKQVDVSGLRDFDISAQDLPRLMETLERFDSISVGLDMNDPPWELSPIHPTIDNAVHVAEFEIWNKPATMRNPKKPTGWQQAVFFSQV
jgi:hypothetical protein